MMLMVMRMMMMVMKILLLQYNHTAECGGIWQDHIRRSSIQAFQEYDNTEMDSNYPFLQ